MELLKAPNSRAASLQQNRKAPRMKKILVPTDFTLASLQPVTRIATTVDGPVVIYLFHAFRMPGSLVEAMNNSPHNLLTEEFRLRCRKIKAQCAHITQISFRPMYGTTLAAFRNYAEANDIDAIALLPAYTFIPVIPESVNPVHMFRKSGIPLITHFTDARPAPHSATLKAMPQLYN